jgi:hypothetical protein
MSLFTKLLNLHAGNKPREDFFSEIVAYFLSINPHILIAWLKYHSIISEDSYSNIKISTQEKYKGLLSHNEDSRLDIQVDLSNKINKDLIFIESKIDAKDGNNNLKKYAEILSHLPNIRHRILIYITRDYDPKEEIKAFTSNLSPEVSFYQVRWYQFYDMLKEHKPDILNLEILKFMENNRMSQNYQFSSIDCLTMANFSKTLNLMELTLSDEVKNKFIEKFGSKNLSRLNLNEWREEGSYTIKKKFPNWRFVCQIGYFNLNAVNLTEYPSLGIALGVSKEFSYYQRCFESMQRVVNDHPSKWMMHRYDSFKWTAIFFTRDMQEFLSEKNHVSAIKNYFINSIDELLYIQDNYFDFPWCDLTTETVEED